MKPQMQQMKELVNLFKALGDQTRMRLLRAIASGMADQISVNDLAKMLQVSQPTVSQHLRILKNVDLIEPERDGYHIYYRINLETMEKHKRQINEMFDVVFTKCSSFPHCE
jgi:DNA-binding transcriptional ArsR family regulator